MPTDIAVVRNDSPRAVLAFNIENTCSSFMLNAGTQSPPTSGGCWISWHEDKPLVLSTSKGVCRIWDKDWKIRGRWDGSSTEVVLLNGQANGVGGAVKLTVAANGDLSMVKQR